jgi:two-component system KDP operon response regulator KdpE
MTDVAGRVLVVDDERAIRHLLRVSLTAHGYTVLEAVNGRDALAQAAAARPDVVILDLGLPDMDGIDVVQQVREWSSVPIIILSVREQETEKVRALDVGADDYLTKPFGMGELMARMRVVVRRAMQPGEEPVLEMDGLVVDLARRIVTVGGAEVSLTPTEYDILRALVRHVGKVLTHGQLLRQVWGVGYESEVHLLRVNVSNLRRKIEPDPARPKYVLTEPGVGYRLWSGVRP